MARIVPRVLPSILLLAALGCGGDDGPPADAGSDAADATDGSDADGAGAPDADGSFDPDACVEVETACDGVDEDCDGVVDDEPDRELCLGGGRCLAGRCRRGAFEWGATFGSSAADGVRGVALGPDGTTVAGGAFAGALDFGDGTRTPAALADAFVVSLSTTGALRWDRSFGGEGADVVQAVVAAEDGTVFAAGQFSATTAGDVDFGGGARASAGDADAFVVALDPYGAYLWDVVVGGTGEDTALAVALLPGGGPVVVGSFRGSVDFGDGARMSAGSSDAFVLALDPDGAHVWDATFGGAGEDVAASVAVRADGSVLAAGSFEDSVDFGSGARTSAGAHDAFVVLLSGDDDDDGEGDVAWDAVFGGGESDSAAGVGSGAGNVVYAGGWFRDEVDFGGGARASGGDVDGFVVALGSDGAYAWDWVFGGAAADRVRSVSAAGALVVAGGGFASEVSFGGAAHVPIDGEDAFVVALTNEGGLRWDRVGGGDGAEHVRAVVAGGEGAVVAAGQFTEDLVFPGGALEATSEGSDDAFVTRWHE